MHAEEKNLIDGLFTRLRTVEGQSAPREAQAEALINEHIARQPAAPYYMAQAIIVQENAIQQLDARVKELEAQVESLRQVQSQPQQSSGGFLSGLFGGRSQPQQPAASAPVSAQPVRSGWHEPAGASRFGQQPGFAQQSAFGQRGMPAQGGGFMSGALQTAAGVAGGMVLGNMLMDMFQGDEAEKVAEAAPAEQPQVAEEAPAAEEADGGFFGGDFFGGGDDEDFV